jgi:uncharacterized membrane-anchored protein YitT (DUF2179 family)
MQSYNALKRGITMAVIKPKIHHEVKTWVYITLGAIISSLGYVLFILPMNMVEGGVTGIGIILKKVTGLPIVGISSLAITAVIFIVAFRILGRGFGEKSIYAAIISNLLIDVFMLLKLPQITDDMLLAAFYGGAIVGLGLGMIYFSGASTGGADATAQVLWKINNTPLGRTLITIDVFVLSLATIIFIPLEQIMYSLIFIFIEVRVIDMVLSGVRANQRIMIISDKPKKISELILTKMNRGLTMFQGVGGFTGEKRIMLTSVVPKKEIPEIRRIIVSLDPKAFVIIQDIYQVYGEGFDPLPKLKKTH